MGIPLDEPEEAHDTEVFQNPDNEFKPLCNSRKNQVNPEDLMRQWKPENDWDFFQNFTQTIEGEKCENEGAICSDSPLGMIKCVQRYITVTLQAMTKEKQLESNNFDIPSYCECVTFKRRTLSILPTENKI